MINIFMEEDSGFNNKLTKKEIDVDCLYINGCSVAVGDELPLDIRDNIRFSTLVGDHYNLPIINNAESGGSNSRIVRTTTQDIIDFKSQGKTPFVIIAWTAHHRFEVCNENHKWIQFNAGKDGKDPDFENMYWRKYGGDLGNIELFAVQVMLMQNFLENQNIPYLMVHASNPVVLPRKHKLADFADNLDYRYFLPDLPLRGYLTQWPDIKFGPGGHPLKEGHKKISEFLIQLIDNRYAFSNCNM